MSDKVIKESEREIDVTMDKLDPKTFFFDVPPYEKVTYKIEDIDRVMELLGYNGQFDAYYYVLDENTTFSGCDNTLYTEDPSKLTGLRDIQIKCKRTGYKLTFYVYFSLASKYIEKVGQYPSIADLHKSKIAKYSKVLSSEKMTEFVRAIGLKAHGVGIGSFVYLRRIFEALIEEAHTLAIADVEWAEDEFKKCKMVEKIKLLKQFLPPFLVEHAKIYGILSLGIHELDEEKCLKYFDPIKMGIEEILEEKIIAKQKRDRRDGTKKLIDAIEQELSE